jgi:FtsP/CotA-like multicopper oxidase with cupredoxin domain
MDGTQTGESSMVFGNELATEPQASLSRRELLRRGALAGASLYPGISLFSATAQGDSSAGSSIAEYELNVAAREARPDGRNRQIWCYNGQLPGPLIRAKLGQKLRIKVVNHLPVATSVHWHGLHQPGTWHMDGVDKVSHEPIPPGQSFVYEFEATPAGTHWYHSHVGVQYGNGLIGPLVIDEPTPPARYDREEILLINDWFLRPAEQILAGLLGPMRPDAKMRGMKMRTAGTRMKGMAEKGMAMKGDKPDIADVPFESALFNGLGRFPGTQAPLAHLRVKQGETLRLRLINASSTYQFRVQIDGHPLTVIATDGAPIVPITVDNLLFSPGERFDVLITADRGLDSWIRAVTLAGDEARASLSYADSPKEPAISPVVWGKRSLALAALRSPTPPTLDLHPREVVLRLGGTMQPYTWNINHEIYPHAQPIRAAKDEWLRFVLDNPTGMDHPFHLHGHYFYVLGTPDRLNLVDPPRKDTVNVPARSRLVLLWQANNPGHWFFHCHIEWHAATGMARVIEIAPR